jgi:hypothetical protein
MINEHDVLKQLESFLTDETLLESTEKIFANIDKIVERVAENQDASELFGLAGIVEATIKRLQDAYENTHKASDTEGKGKQALEILVARLQQVHGKLLRHAEQTFTGNLNGSSEKLRYNKLFEKLQKEDDRVGALKRAFAEDPGFEAYIKKMSDEVADEAEMGMRNDVEKLRHEVRITHDTVELRRISKNIDKTIKQMQDAYNDSVTKDSTAQLWDDAAEKGKETLEMLTKMLREIQEKAMKKIEKLPQRTTLTAINEAMNEAFSWFEDWDEEFLLLLEVIGNDEKLESQQSILKKEFNTLMNMMKNRAASVFIKQTAEKKKQNRQNSQNLN